MSNCIDSFPIGTEVEFEVCVETGYPKWNYGSRTIGNRPPFKVMRGVVCSQSGDKVKVEFSGKVLRQYWWFQVTSDLIGVDGNIRLSGGAGLTGGIKNPSTCKCDSFSLTHYGHDDGCPEKPSRRNKYS